MLPPPLAGLVAGIFVPQLGGQLAQGVQSLLGLTGNALLSGYGRSCELEGDRLGAEYLARSGYNPQAMIKVIGVLKNQELFDIEITKQEGRAPRRYHSVFATHPDNDTRLQEVIAEAKQYAPPGRISAPNRRHDIRRCRQSWSRVRKYVSTQGDGHHVVVPAQWRTRNKSDEVIP